MWADFIWLPGSVLELKADYPPIGRMGKKTRYGHNKPTAICCVFWGNVLNLQFLVVSPSDKSSDPNQFDWPPIDPTASSFKPTNHYLFFLLKEMGVRTISK